MLIIIGGCNHGKDAVEQSFGMANQNLPPDVEADVVAFCGDCHGLPVPSSFPKDAWHAEVRRGFDFYYASGRTDLVIPRAADVQKYFVSRAPDELTLPAPDPVDLMLADQFKITNISLDGIGDAAISFVDVVDAGGELGRGIVFSDMRHGGIYFVSIDGGGHFGLPIELGRARNPAVVRAVDWNKDALIDFVVADLGTFLPADHQMGQIILLEQRSDSPGQFRTQVLHSGVGRVAAVEVADFDSDGLEDLLVAEFGWHKTGSIFWLRRQATTDTPSEAFLKHLIDSRSGAIHVPVVDLNGDGLPDFVALFSQEHERIEAMINDGRGNFNRKLVYAAPGPSYGSSGIELADVNGDGRIDVIYTNGDSFDSFILKPFHAVRWLENQGTFPFTDHQLGSLPGAHRGVAGDVDGNGHLDIVAGAFIPRDLLLSKRYDGAEALVLWLQSQAGSFTKHVISNGQCLHAALTVSDLNGDGRMDFVVGNFREKGVESGPALTIWQSR